jgi:hypothetical protein
MLVAVSNEPATNVWPNCFLFSYIKLFLMKRVLGVRLGGLFDFHLLGDLHRLCAADTWQALYVGRWHG